MDKVYTGREVGGHFLVRSLVGARGCVAGVVPGQGASEGRSISVSHIIVFLPLFPSL